MVLGLETKEGLDNNIQHESDDDYEEQQEDVVLITMPMQEMSLQADETEGANCYECYKAIYDPQLHYDEKYFCTELCMDKYLAQLRVTML